MPLSVTYINRSTEIYSTGLSRPKNVHIHDTSSVNQYTYDYKRHISSNSQWLRQYRMDYLSGRVVSCYIWESLRLSSRVNLLYEEAKSTIRHTFPIRWLLMTDNARIRGINRYDVDQVIFELSCPNARYTRDT